MACLFGKKFLPGQALSIREQRTSENRVRIEGFAF
jgi:hypothetical protein